VSLRRSITSGLRELFRKAQVRQQLDEELNGFLEMAADEKVKQGMSRTEALRAVSLERGSLEVTKEIVRRECRIGRFPTAGVYASRRR